MKIIKVLCGIIVVLCIFQINSFANTNSTQTHQDGIYKIVSSIDMNKSIEIPGGSIEDNIQLGLWDYRRWNTSKSPF